MCKLERLNAPSFARDVPRSRAVVRRDEEVGSEAVHTAETNVCRAAAFGAAHARELLNLE